MSIGFNVSETNTSNQSNTTGVISCVSSFSIVVCERVFGHGTLVSPCSLTKSLQLSDEEVAERLIAVMDNRHHRSRQHDGLLSEGRR